MPHSKNNRPPPRTHHTARTLTGQTPGDKPHSTDSTDVLHASCDSSAKPLNNRRRHKPPTAPNQDKITAIPTSTTDNNYINLPTINNKHTTSPQTFASNPHIQQHCQLTDNMEEDRPQSSPAPRGRRANQRYRRGAHNVTLSLSARLALTQQFAATGRTQPPTASDPISLNIISYFSAPLGGRRVLEAVLPPKHDRADLSVDPIYSNHPSDREGLQHPLLLHTASQGLNSVVIENYYVTGVHSSNTHNDASFSVFIYLPND